ncbi:MAG: DUF1460 domain-containing protein [Prevotella sp.]|nr:DUF1460 domain-containing protein [Prevotella sp.]
MKYLRPLIFLLCVIPYMTQAQNIIYSKSDSVIYSNYITQFNDQKDNSVSELIIKSAKFFLGKPYVASTLEVAGNETLTLNLRELDCTTFIENCIVLSRVIKSGDHSFDNYCKTLQNMRYRNGVIDGYTSRLHYTSDWIYENEQRNILQNISLEIGGEIVSHPLNFMSGHPTSYKHLKDNPSNTNKMKDIETAINKRNNYRIIPLASIQKNERGIKDGDIIAFATGVSGLDYSHVGIAYWQNGQLHFIHASSRAKEVVIEKKTLLDYCKDSKNCTGISVLRIK